MAMNISPSTAGAPLSAASPPLDVRDLDSWVESLMQCKQLSENDVKRLCDKVCPIANYNDNNNNNSR